MKKILIAISLCTSILASAQSPITWNMGMNIAANSYSNMHPRMALDGKGNPLVVWGRMSDESVMFSRWNGTTFTTPVKLNPPWLTVASASWMGSDIATFGDTVYVVVKRTPETSDTNHIYIITSFNGGVSFSAPVRVSFIGDSLARFSTVTTDATGNPIVAFMKFNSSFLESRWVVTKSNDFGKTFSTDVKASGYSGTKAEVCDCCPGAIVSSGNKTAMLYRDNNSNIRDIWVGISNNNATTFPSGFEVDNNNWMVMSCPASGPDGVIVGDTLYSVFMSRGSGNYRNYLSKASINGVALSSVMQVSGPIAGLSQQNYPRIATDGRAMAVVWKQTVSGISQLPILFANKVSKGFPAAYDTVDLGDITNADVAVSNGNLFVVWEDDNSGTVKFRKGTFTPSASVKEIAEHHFSVHPNPAQSAITLQSDVDLENAEIIILNLLGEAVLSQPKLEKINPAIDITDLRSGIYFINIKSNNKFFNQKFVKQ